MKVKGLSRFYLLIAALFLGMLYINSKYFRGSSNSHVGITFSKNYNITSEKSGVIKEIKVLPGEEVKTGDLLVRMENTGLQIEISKMKNRIDALRKEKYEKASLAQSKIEYLKAESGIVLEELESEIQQIRSELQLNRELTRQFSNAEKSVSNEVRNTPQTVKIASLKQAQKLNVDATDIKIKDLTQTHETDIMVLENEIKLLEQEMDMLLSQQDQLAKYATFNGVVESVLVRKGEEVPAFAPILSINPKHPTSVVGYMSGNKPREMQVGSKVKVRSYSNKKAVAQGEVIGFGSIAELPLVLQKSTAVKAFGIEVFIKIPEENPFFTGEKVLIK
ncbi:MAG TPA: biotin/lipoyl-binding protein [Cytophagales bacterium]|nr:biotin/lipoyl-binding protein [Cytophagales bacterium]